MEWYSEEVVALPTTMGHSHRTEQPIGYARWLGAAGLSAAGMGRACRSGGGVAGSGRPVFKALHPDGTSPHTSDTPSS